MNLDNPNEFLIEDLAKIVSKINSSRILNKDPGFIFIRRSVSIIWILIDLLCTGFLVVMKEDVQRLLMIRKSF